MEEFKKEYDKNKLYIMKKNVQRQEGIIITKDYDKLTNGIKDEFIIIQELLQNPFILNGRKINLRVYILVVVKNNKCSTYVYNDGFMYYTPQFFVKGSADIDRNVTTGYIDRKVYEENPLTHEDFRIYLGRDEAKIVFYNVYELIKNVMSPFQEHLVKFQAFPGSTQFQLFGADVAVNNDLSSTLMEINKGPDLSYKDKRDGEVKKNLIEDMFNLVGVINIDKQNRFIKVA
jgi:tubulin polyglutamylase TTLL7